MNIEIHKPEVERRVREGIKSGRFHDVDELLTRALDALSEKEASPPHSGAALVEAMQASRTKRSTSSPEGIACRCEMPIHSGVATRRRITASDLGCKARSMSFCFACRAT